MRFLFFASFQVLHPSYQIPVLIAFHQKETDCDEMRLNGLALPRLTD